VVVLAGGRLVSIHDVSRPAAEGVPA